MTAPPGRPTFSSPARARASGTPLRRGGNPKTMGAPHALRLAAVAIKSSPVDVPRAGASAAHAGVAHSHVPAATTVAAPIFVPTARMIDLALVPSDRSTPAG